MTRNDLKRAYDSLNPTEEEKSRMLQNILSRAELAPEEEPETHIQYRRSNPAPERKPKFALIAACVAFFLLGGVFLTRFLGNAEPPVAVEPTTEIVFAENPYQELLDKYALAIRENWTGAQCTDAGISSRTPIDNEYDGLYYAISDLDGNGVQELVITEQDYPPDTDMDFLDLYTLEEGKPVLICSDRDFLRPALCEGGIVKTFSAEAENTTHYDKYVSFRRINGTILEVDLIVYQIDNQWYMGFRAFAEITREEADKAVADYMPAKLELTQISGPADSTEATENSYESILAKYVTAIQENWTEEQCEAADISDNIPYAEGLGWCLMDIDGNGTQELIIADNAEVFDLYTPMPDGLPGHILMSWGANSYELCQGGIIEMREYYSKGSGWFWMALDGVDLIQKDMLHYTNYDELDQYSYGPDSDHLEVISHDEAGELIFRYPAMELELTLFPARQVIDAVDEEALFMPVMETYGKALKEDWNPGQCMENGISLMIGYYGELYDSVGFAFMDLDGDGIDELLVTDGNYIYDLYSFINTEEDIPVRVFSASERSTWMLVQGSRNRDNEGTYLYNHGSGGAGYGTHVYYRLQEGNLIPVEGYLYDVESNPENPWFYYDGFEAGENCGDFDAEAVVNGSWSSDVIDFIPLEG